MLCSKNKSDGATKSFAFFSPVKVHKSINIYKSKNLLSDYNVIIELPMIS